jgi:hypothetical protein
MTSTRVLISYARADSLEASARLRMELQQAGFEVWRDIEEMRGGKDWKEQIRQAIGEVDAVVVLLTPASVVSKYVLWECDTALTLSRRVIGLLSLPCDVPEALSSLHYHNLSTADKYVVGFASLVRDLNELGDRSMPEHEQDNGPSPVHFDLRGAQISKTQFGNSNTMYNNAPQDTSALVQHIMQLLRSEHQQLRVMLLAELGAMSADQRQQLDMILAHHRSGQISPHDLADFMVAVRAVLTHLQEGSLAANSELVRISQQLEQVYGSTLTQQHQFELTLPIVPMLLQYRYSFGGSIDTNLRGLIDKLKRSWTLWAR